jgi:hypothetical protein
MSFTEKHEDRRTRAIGRRGTLREALSLSGMSLAMARYCREDAGKISALNFDIAYGEAGKLLLRAARAKRNEMRQEAAKALWWGLVAQIRIASGAPLA